MTIVETPKISEELMTKTLIAVLSLFAVVSPSNLSAEDKTTSLVEPGAKVVKLVPAGIVAAGGPTRDDD